MKTIFLFADLLLVFVALRLVSYIFPRKFGCIYSVFISL